LGGFQGWIELGYPLVESEIVDGSGKLAAGLLTETKAASIGST
jgi:hypothetical protein